MTNHEFKEYLLTRRIYFVEEDKYIVIKTRSVLKINLKTIPDNVIFNSKSDIILKIETMPKSIEFNNHGNIHFTSLTEIPHDVIFHNKVQAIVFHKAVLILKKVVFNNRKLVNFQKRIDFNNNGMVKFNNKTVKLVTSNITNQMKFNNTGGIILNEVIVIDNDVKFNNEGEIYVNYNKNIDNLFTIQHNKRQCYLKNLSASTYCLGKSRKFKDYEIQLGKKFNGNKIKKSKSDLIFVVSKNGMISNSTSAFDAIFHLEQVLMFEMKHHFVDVVKNLKRKKTVSIGEFALVSSMSISDLKTYLHSIGISHNEANPMPLDDALSLSNNFFNGRFFRKTMSLKHI